MIIIFVIITNKAQNITFDVLPKAMPPPSLNDFTLGDVKHVDLFSQKDVLRQSDCEDRDFISQNVKFPFIRILMVARLRPAEMTSEQKVGRAKSDKES